MNMPGFTGEASLGMIARIYRGGAGCCRSALGARRSTFPAVALRGSTEIGSRGAAATSSAKGGLGFGCGSGSCGCVGIDACLDLLITTDLCGPSIDCGQILGVNFCTCTRK
jgi:hypothetical protein